MGNNVFNSLLHNSDSKKVLGKFSQGEIRLIKATFKDLALRSPGPTIDRNTFLTHFPLPGLHGEQLFAVFDYNASGNIDFDEFINGIAVAYKGSFDEQFELVFKIYDISKDGFISPQELRTMLHHVPNDALHVWHLKKTSNAQEEKSELQNGSSESNSTSNNSNDGGSDEVSATHPSFATSLWSKTDGNVPKNGASISTSPVDDSEINEIIEKFVEEAFGENNLSEDKKLSFDSFKQWVKQNPEVMVLFNSVFSSFGKTSFEPQSSAFSPPTAFEPPKRRSVTPPPSHKHFGLFNRSGQSSSRNKKDQIKNEAQRASSSSSLQINDSKEPKMTRNSHSFTLKPGRLLHSRQQSVEPEGYSQLCIKHGTLYKVGRRYGRMQNRYYKLYGNILYYYNSERSNTPSGVIMMPGCFVDPTENTDQRYHAFKIVTGKGGERDERVLHAKSIDERDGWIKVLRRASCDRKFTKMYVLKHKIGTGKFSNVYLCTSKSSNIEYAVKLIKKDHLSIDERELLRTEIAILRLVEHPFIVRLIDVFETVENMYLVMELQKGGELYHCIVGRPRFSASEAYVLLKQIMEGISYLHSAGIVHRDVKPENILLSKPIPKGSRLDSTFHLKLADFGLSKLVAPGVNLTLPCGTISYVAPEVLSQEGYGVEADNWSIGVILYLVLRGKLPFNSEEKDEIIQEILKNDVEWEKDPIFSKLDPGLVEIVKGLLEKDKTKRFTALNVLNHEWMKAMKKLDAQIAAGKEVDEVRSTVTEAVETTGSQVSEEGLGC